MTNAEEINVKNYVWVTQEDQDDLYVKGYITDYFENEQDVKMAKVTIINGNKESVKVVRQDQLESCNPAKFNKCTDMAELTHLNEPSVLYNLYLRYNDDMIYTYSGLFLVAINPYKSLPIYDIEYLNKFHNHDFEKPPPHIYATAEGTYRNLLQNHKDQSILVTGESGAGKTENTKKIIQYLSSITDKSKRTSVYGQNIDIKILQANPILESFGNAKTIKNNNSSRFGKFIRIFFSPNGSIAFANIDYYLLEKSRVASQSPQERNYHVFYQLLKGHGDLEKLGLLKDISSYKYLTNNIDIPHVDDEKEFNMLVDAFKLLGMTQKEIDNIFQMLAVVLLLGNLDFTSWKSEQANFTADSPVEKIASILGITKTDLSNNLLRPKVKAGKEYVQKSRRASEVKYAIDALAKHLYERLFQFIIELINKNLNTESEIDLDFNFIGVLDIAGFEIFETNSFEQLCINYTNEKLQQFFNHHSFILEQSEYLREDIQWEFIDFGLDLQPTIDLIEMKQPMGIFKLLDEECLMPKSSDRSFMEKLESSWGKGKSSKFKLNKFKSGFIIHHYAGMVEYNVENWLQKNTDPVDEHVLKLLPQSSNPFVAELLAHDEHLQPESNNKRRSKLKTASFKHKEQLSSLMEQLESTQPSFVRCILPNLEKKPNKFDKRLVLNQLRCNGVLEGIRITRAGYPNRMTFDEFYQRYAIINTKEMYTKNNRTNSDLILKHINLDPDSYKVGITKIFFKNGILGNLEEMRDLTLKSLFTEFQSIVRGKSARASINVKIKEIQSAQLVARNLQTMSEALKSSPWLALFIKMKPLMEESIKVLDSKELNENLKKAEEVKANLEVENEKLKEQMNKLENEIITTTDLIKSKDAKLEKYKNSEMKSVEKVQSLESKLAELKETHAKALKDKTIAEQSSIDLSKKLKEHTETLTNLRKDHKEKSEKVSTLEQEIKSHIDAKSKHAKELDFAKSDLENTKTSLTLHNQKLEQSLQKLKTELESQREISSKDDMLNNEIKSLKETIEDLKQSISSKEKEISTLKASSKAHEMEITEIQKKLDDTNQELKETKSHLNKKTREANEANEKLEKSELMLQEVKSNLKKVENEKNIVEAQVSKESALQKEIESLKKSLSVSVEENKAVTESHTKLQREMESNHQAKLEYTKKIVDLKNEISELENSLKAKTVDKENQPPDKSFVEEFSSMKAKLNEHKAALRVERLESKKLSEELSILKERISSGSIQEFSPRKSGASIESFSSDKILNDEIKSLTNRLHQEEANAQRAENYAIELQKKINKMQSNRGLSGSNDLEQKYKESQAKIAELEHRFSQVASSDVLSNSSTPPQDQVSRNSSFGTPIGHASQDFVAVYHDLTKTLKTTREELGQSKAEILRLKKLLRESEDELLETKKESFKTSVSEYESYLATLKSKHESVKGENIELTRSLEIYKERATNYYKELVKAEAAVNSATRSKEIAKNEAQQAITNLNLAREESRSAQILIKELRKQAGTLQDTIQDKEYEISKAKNQIKELNDKVLYSTNIENKELTDNYKEEIRELHKDLNFRMKSETELVKANKKLQLDFEEISRIKKGLEEEYEQKLLVEERLEKELSQISSKSAMLENEKVMNNRKIDNLTKQVASLKEVIEEVGLQRDKLIETKRELEEKIHHLTTELDDTTDKLKQKDTDNIMLRQHLENKQAESDSIRNELNQSKLGSTNDVEDYQHLAREHLVTSQENEALKKINDELNTKVNTLEDKLYSNEQLKFWEMKVNDLKQELDQSQQQNYESSKSIKELERQIQQQNIRIENETRISKRYNDENFDFQNKICQYKSAIDILHNENSEKDLLLKSTEMENSELKERLLQMEKEVLQLKEQLY